MPVFLLPLVTWLGTSFVTAIAFFVSRKGILFATMLTVISLVGTATNFLVSEIDGLIGSVLPTSLGLAASFAPNNTQLCLTAIISTHLACTGYRLVIKFIRWKTEILTS
tara:strand:+ start:2249 stop:2575 length:327 start_codon:yes stop_codon:yes gene_type:complete